MKKILSLFMVLIALAIVSCNNDSSNSELGVVTVAEPSIVGTGEVSSCFQLVSATPLRLIVEEGDVSSQLSSQFIYAKTSVTVKCLKECNEKYYSLILLLLDEYGSPLYECNGQDVGRKYLIYNDDLNKMKVGEEATFTIQVRIREDGSLSEGVVNDEKVKEEILKPIKKVSLKKSDRF